MAAIEPVLEPTEALDKTLESFTRMSDETGRFPRILAHVPAYAEAVWGAMAEALFEGDVDHQLKEMMRIQLAVSANDSYFSSIRSIPARQSGLTEERIAAGLEGFKDDPQFTDAEKWALEYSYLMYRHPEQVDAAFYEAGKVLFTEAQIMELGGLIAVHYGLSMFMSTLDG